LNKQRYLIEVKSVGNFASYNINSSSSSDPPTYHQSKSDFYVNTKTNQAPATNINENKSFQNHSSYMRKPFKLSDHSVTHVNTYSKFKFDSEYYCKYNEPIIDESKRLLIEFETLRTKSNLEIRKAQDSLSSSLLWLENRKLK
jgi:hypothetical protein